MSPPFALDPRLAAATVPLAEARLSRLLLMDDRRYVWLLLVPRRPGVAELHELSAEESGVLMAEIRAAAAAHARAVAPHNINVATLGNIVRQLHIHIVARFAADAAWPGPIWGHGTPEPYAEADRTRLIARLTGLLGDLPR